MRERRRGHLAGAVQPGVVPRPAAHGRLLRQQGRRQRPDGLAARRTAAVRDRLHDHLPRLDSHADDGAAEPAGPADAGGGRRRAPHPDRPCTAAGPSSRSPRGTSGRCACCATCPGRSATGWPTATCSGRCEKRPRCPRRTRRGRVDTTMESLFRYVAAPSHVRLLAGSVMEPGVRVRRRHDGRRVPATPDGGLAALRLHAVPAGVPRLHGLPIAARPRRPLPVPTAARSGRARPTPGRSNCASASRRSAGQSWPSTTATTPSRPTTRAGRSTPPRTPPATPTPSCATRSRWRSGATTSTAGSSASVTSMCCRGNAGSPAEAGLSAIYFFYDPLERQRSLGTYNVLCVIDEARRRGLPYAYLGYYVEGCAAMAYKTRFVPNDCAARTACGATSRGGRGGVAPPPGLRRPRSRRRAFGERRGLSPPSLSFPNSCLGTRDCEALLRVRSLNGTRNGVSRKAFPNGVWERGEAELGNEGRLCRYQWDKPGGSPIPNLMDTTAKRSPPPQDLTDAPDPPRRCRRHPRRPRRRPRRSPRNLPGADRPPGERIRAWVLVDRDGARAEAAAATEELRRGQYRGPLHGIPIGIKDIFDVFDWPTAAGSRLWANSIARQDATVVRQAARGGGGVRRQDGDDAVRQLRPAADAQPVEPGADAGRHRAAARRRPWRCGMCLGALGSQTGGSITRPASYCGVAGVQADLRPRQLRSASCRWRASMDHPGPMARCVRDLAILLQAIAGSDPSRSVAADLIAPITSGCDRAPAAAGPAARTVRGPCRAGHETDDG